MGTAIGYVGFGVLGTWISEFYPARSRALGSNATYYVARGLGSGLYPLFALTPAGGDLRIALALGGIGAALGLVGCLFVPDTAGPNRARPSSRSPRAGYATPICT